MRLRGLIATLEALPPDAPVELDFGQRVRGLTSWRGRYNELTLCWAVPGSDGATVAALLAEAREALAGKVFEGWKGGDYTMHEGTPIWADEAGECLYHAVHSIDMENGTALVSTFNVEDYA